MDRLRSPAVMLTGKEDEKIPDQGVVGAKVPTRGRREELLEAVLSDRGGDSVDRGKAEEDEMGKVIVTLVSCSVRCKK